MVQLKNFKNNLERSSPEVILLTKLTSEALQQRHLRILNEKKFFSKRNLFILKG